jgi:hypothetical protein
MRSMLPSTRVAVALGSLVFGMLAPGASAQDVVVTSATPSSTPQGTVGLDVTIAGQNFKKGAIARFLVTGTTNPGGVTVNSTTFKNPNTLVANVTTSDTALVAGFDIEILAAGRSGKGTDLFHVTEKATGQVDCTPRTTPQFGAPIARLNSAAPGGGPRFTDGFGQRIAMREVVRPDLTRVLVLLVPTRNQKAYVFVLDPATAAQVQPVQAIDLPAVDPTRPFFPQYGTAVGDLDADGVPDFAMANTNPGTVYVLRGRMDGAGVLTYDATTRYRLTAPAGEETTSFGRGLGIGNLDGGADELVVMGGTGTKIRGSLTGARAYVYKFTAASLGLVNTMTPSLPGGFEPGEGGGGFGVGVGQVDLGPAGELVAGSQYRDVAGVTDAGAVFVFSGLPLGSTPVSTLQPSPAVNGGNFGVRVALLPPIDTTQVGPSSLIVASNDHSEIFAGPIGATPSPIGIFRPESGLDGGWAYYETAAGDLNADGVLDLAISASGAQFASSCGAMGITYVYLSQGPASAPNWQRVALQPPDLSGRRFGTGVALASKSGSGGGFVIVGDTSALVAGTDGAGQVYIYRLQ